MSGPTAEPRNSPFPDARLTDVIPWGHRFLQEVLRPGDLAVDLTAGTGQDTLFLFRCVSPGGRVVAFDIQEAALERTRKRLEEGGASVHTLLDGNTPTVAGVHLVRACHSGLGRYMDGSPRAVIANLGYLPGSDGKVRTAAGSTVAALDDALERLAPGGRIAMVVYIGHPGGEEEAEAVEARLRSLPASGWQVLRLEAANRSRAPFLLLAQKD